MDNKVINKMRWDPYVLIKGEKVATFWKDHFSNGMTKVLYILGKGFDVRMNIGLANLLEQVPGLKPDVLLINFNEGAGSHSLNYKFLVEENSKELDHLVKNRIGLFTEKNINLWQGTGKKKRRVGDRQVAELFQDISELEYYEEIVVDISALPRGIYFSLIGKILTLIDNFGAQKNPNLYIVTAENAEFDSKIVEKGVDEDLHYPLGFGGGLELESRNFPAIWLPLLGENKSQHFEKANQHIRPSEICPLLPFPSKNPRRSDDIFIEYHELLFDVLRVEPQNIMYVPEQNPFEVYKKVIHTIKKYNDSLSILGGCNAVITTFSSKTLSIGVFLAAYELRDNPKLNAGILNVDSQGYEILDIENVKKMKDESELFVTWLTGIPYI